MIDARRRLDAFLHRPRRTRRLPLWPPHHGSTTASAASRRRTQRMCAMEATARELLATAQDDRNAKLDAGRVDTVFMVGDRVQLRPTSCSTPQTLAPVVGRSFHGARLPSLPQPGSQEPSPPPAVDAAVAARRSNAAARRRRRRHLATDDPPPLAAAMPLLTPRRWWSLRPASGYRPAEMTSGPAFLGRTVLYCWPGDGWIREMVARRIWTQGFSHVVRVRYGPRSALGAAMLD